MCYCTELGYFYQKTWKETLFVKKKEVLNALKFSNEYCMDKTPLLVLHALLLSAKVVCA